LNNTSNSYFDVYDGGNAVISNNTLSGEYAGVESSNIIDNTFSGCDIAIEGAGTIEGNLIYQCSVGINLGQAQAIIQNNTIANNTLGIQMPYSSSSEIIYNNIQNNQVSISLIDTYTNNFDSSNVNATYNWWGTTDQQAINQTIFDFKDNFNLGTVNFVPFLAAPNTQAPVLPTSTATPTPTASPTINPTQTPSSTPTITPTVPEFSAMILLPLLLSLFSFAVLVRHRKTANLKQ
jgi:hypothetical protein